MSCLLTYQSKAIGNRGPKIRLLFHRGIYAGLSRDKMQNLKIRCKTIPIYGQFHRPLGLFCWEVFKNFHMDRLLVFWLTSHTSTKKIKNILIYPFQSLCWFSPCSSESPAVQRVVELVTSKGKLWRLSTDKMSVLIQDFGR